MVDLFFTIFWFLTVFGVKIKGIDNFFFDYMELEDTNCIKGIFVWLIIFCHKISYGNQKKYLYYKIAYNLGQKVVSIFFFIQVLESVNQLKKKVLIILKL